MTTKMKATGIDQLLNELQSEFGAEKIAPLLKASERWRERNPEGTDSDWAKSMVLEAISYVAEDETYWTFVASRIHLHEVYTHEKKQRGKDVYVDFAGHVERLVNKGLYTPVLTEKYSKEDLTILGKSY